MRFQPFYDRSQETASKVFLNFVLSRKNIATTTNQAFFRVGGGRRLGGGVGGCVRAAVGGGGVPAGTGGK